MSGQLFTAQQSRAMVAQLKRAQIFRDDEQAFRETTGLPMPLRRTEAFDLPHHGDPKENSFCALMAKSDLNLHKRVSEVGFQSLSQFNRVFRRIAGESLDLSRSVAWRQWVHRSFLQSLI